MDPKVFLFDLDGVLVRPGGYRAAVRATVNYFTNQLGLGDLAPDDETVAIFEAQGITCEWDMVPLILAIVLDNALARFATPAAAPPRLDSLQATADWLRQQPMGPFVLDYAPLMRAMGRYVRPGEAPADSILAACRAGAADGLLTRLAGQAVLADLLAYSRWLARSRTTPIFEAFALGDEVYTRFTGLPTPVRSESLLAKYDVPLLSPAVRDRLLALRQANRLRFAAYTARPSQPTRKSEELLAVYAPEAEMALAQIGIDPFPLMGSGQMGEAARKLGEWEDRLLKPAPYHAVAAIGAAWTGDRSAALDWAEQVFCYFEQHGRCPQANRPDPAALRLPPQLDLHVFEDSPAGMRGGLHAAEMLVELGLTVDLHLWGIATHPEKAAALASVGAQVFPDVNTAVEAALHGL